MSCLKLQRFDFVRVHHSFGYVQYFQGTPAPVNRQQVKTVNSTSVSLYTWLARQKTRHRKTELSLSQSRLLLSAGIVLEMASKSNTKSKIRTKAKPELQESWTSSKVRQLRYSPKRSRSRSVSEGAKQRAFSAGDAKRSAPPSDATRKASELDLDKNNSKISSKKSTPMLKKGEARMSSTAPVKAGAATSKEGGPSLKSRIESPMPSNCTAHQTRKWLSAVKATIDAARIEQGGLARKLGSDARIKEGGLTSKNSLKGGGGVYFALFLRGGASGGGSTQDNVISPLASLLLPVLVQRKRHKEVKSEDQVHPSSVGDPFAHRLPLSEMKMETSPGEEDKKREKVGKRDGSNIKRGLPVEGQDSHFYAKVLACPYDLNGKQMCSVSNF